MASSTLNRTASAVSAPRHFGPDDAARARRSARSARAICRVVALAVDAQSDGSVSFEDGAPTRWWSSIDVARARLEEARDFLIEAYDAPSIDWHTPLHLVEALGAAMWNSHALSDVAMDHVEIGEFLAAAVESINAFLHEIDAASITTAH